jgi:hypothetical protein
MIKVWILMVFLTMPTLNTVRYMGELTYSLEDCELRASLKTVWMEEWAAEKQKLICMILMFNA